MNLKENMLFASIFPALVMSDSNILEIHNLKYKSKICNEISINS